MTLFSIWKLIYTKYMPQIMKITKYQKPISDDFIYTKPDQRFHFVGKRTSKVTISLTERKRDREGTRRKIKWNLKGNQYIISKQTQNKIEESSLRPTKEL